MVFVSCIHLWYSGLYDPEFQKIAKIRNLDRFGISWPQMKGKNVYFTIPTGRTGFGHCGHREPATSEKSPFWHPDFEDLYLRNDKTYRIASGCIWRVFTSTLSSWRDNLLIVATGSGNPEHPENMIFAVFVIKSTLGPIFQIGFFSKS